MEGQSKQQIKKKTKLVSIKLLVLLAVFSLTLFIFWMIAGEIVLEHESGFDTSVFHKLTSITSPFATKIMLFFTFLGSSEFLLPAYIILTAYYLFLRKNSRL
ncbi:MAG: hypothetical protein M3004_13535, partial [Bacteroidota bacterium]|nr:hypothetical protein [Bacteroidota bacterium]